MQFILLWIRIILSKKILVDLVLVALLLAIGVCHTEQISQFLDIGLYDESSYLKYGLDTIYITPPAEAAPFYAYWYRLLSVIEPNPIELYYLNYKAMTIIPSIALFIFLRASAVNLCFALPLALWLLHMPGNFTIWPKVSHFALILFLIGATLALQLRSWRARFTVFTLVCLAMSYARPEYFLSVVLFFSVTLAAYLRDLNKKNTRRSSLVMILLLPLVSVGSVSLLGNPMASGDRSMLAFGQHFSLNWVKNTGDDRNPWTNWELIVRKEFGDVESVGQAFLANPATFARHIVANIHESPKHLASTFLQTYPRSKPGDLRLLQIVLTGLGVILFALAFASYLRRSMRRHSLNGGYVQKYLFSNRLDISALAIFLIPSAISVLIIYPRQHHIFLGGWIAISIFIALLARKSDGDRLIARESQMLIIGLSLVLIKPISAPLHHETQVNLKTIEFLTKLNITRQVNILEAEGGFHIYLGRNYRRIAEYDKRTPWVTFMEENKINMILTTKNLVTDSRFFSDKQWLQFIQTPERFGFEVLTLPNLPDRKLYYKTELIKTN